MVVQLPSDAAAFFLLRVNQAAGEVSEIRLVPAEIAVQTRILQRDGGLRGQ